ncbi:hypothetical protein H0N98_00845 [Candidatus Micrarchaeota archaeon]|nr:hypothetical protein [Candidatus Micrarchaeota archaeon]
MHTMVEKTDVALEELPRKIPIKELCPPSVYFPTHAATVNYLFGPGNETMNKLMLHLERKKVMSEMEVIEFIKKELPEISERRAMTLLWRVVDNGGVVNKGVIIGEDRLKEYFKALTAHRDKERVGKSRASLISHGIDPQLASVLSSYSMNLLKPFFDNPAQVNKLFYNQQVGFKNMNIAESKIRRYTQLGVFPDDIEKFGSDIVDELTWDYQKMWREQLEGIREVCDRYGFDHRKHRRIYEMPKNILEANLEACKKRGRDPEESKLVSALKLPPDEFEKVLDRKKGM